MLSDRKIMFQLDMLELRRLWADVVELFKIVNNYLSCNVNVFILLSFFHNTITVDVTSLNLLLYGRKKFF